MDQLLPLLGVIAVLFALIAVAYLIAWKLGLLKPGAEDEARLPYKVADRLLSQGEAAFLGSLQVALARTLGLVPGSALMPTIYAKVRLGDVLYVNGKGLDNGGRTSARNKIDRKHADFVLCDPRSTKPLLIVELDDRTHNRPDRQDRDAFVDGACRSAGLSILHVPARASYNIVELSEQLRQGMAM